jgi:diguanylate cyclase (GGDEF)-like protein
MRFGSARVVVAVCLALCIPAIAAPGALASRTLLDVTGVVIASAVWAGARRRERAVAHAWRCFAAAIACWVVAHGAANWWARYGNPPAVSVVHAVAFAGYALMAYGLVRMVRLRAPGYFGDGWLDGLALATAATVAAWEFMIVPRAHGMHVSMQLLVCVAFPLCDVALLAALAWLALSPGARGTPTRLAMVALGGLLVIDTARVLVPLHAPAFDAQTLEAYYGIALSLLAAAALHPDADELTRPSTRAAIRLHPARVVFLAVTLFTAPAIAIGRATGMSAPARVFLLGSSVALGAIVLARFTIAARQRESAQDALAYQATHDELTGLVNRPLLLDRVAHALGQRRSDNTLVALLYFDLDRFKPINDTWGHRAGDAVLVEVSRRVMSILREGDTLARVGGDEFVVLCEGVAGPHDATAIAERVLIAVSEPIVLGDATVTVGASIGIAMPTASSTTPEALVKDADAAMYRAKERGRDRYEIYDVAMADWLEQRRATEAALQRALTKDELRLVYQPVVRMSTGELAGFEALIRWDRPGYGVVPPSEFITIAEDTGLIVPIGVWVLANACRQLAAWNHAYPDRAPLDIAVNVSVRQFRQPGFIDALEQVIAETGIDPSWLLLEVTESMLLTDTDAALARLDSVKALGARLAIDDFGTGYSSLAYLRRFPLDVVKIDKTFTQDLGNEAADTTLIAGVVALTHVLGHTIVAEGAETIEQVMTLQALRCDFVQGYFFSTPLEAIDADALVAGNRNLVEQVLARAAS